MNRLVVTCLRKAIFDQKRRSSLDLAQKWFYKTICSCPCDGRHAQMPVRFWSNSSASRCELPIICGKRLLFWDSNFSQKSLQTIITTSISKGATKTAIVNVTKWLSWFQSNDLIFKQVLSRQTDKKPRYQFIWPNNGNLICLSQSNRWFSRICNKQKRSRRLRSVPTWQFVAVMDERHGEEEDDANFGRSAAHSWRPTFSNRENLGHLLLLTFY